MVRKIIACALLVMAPVIVSAAGGGGHVERANIDISNEASLQRGAKYFVNYCLGCHSAKYVRYNRLAMDLGLTEDQLVDNLMFTGERPFDTMDNAIPGVDSANWFGRTPPDLSLTARARGADWVYSFLRSFYLDPSKPTGTNNLVLPGASMPHVLWDLQGVQEAVFRTETGPDGNPHEVFDRFEIVQPGRLSPEEFDGVASDLAAFLTYISEPVQLERKSLGIKVILFLVVLFLFAFLFKKELWKDVR
jgi:ubiquinol-cytochrome c reductase cytochrome c1 subunit